MLRIAAEMAARYCSILREGAEFLREAARACGEPAGCCEMMREAVEKQAGSERKAVSPTAGAGLWVAPFCRSRCAEKGRQEARPVC